MARKNSLKYFIGYNDIDNIRSLRIKVPQMIGYDKYIEIIIRQVI